MNAEEADFAATQLTVSWHISGGITADIWAAELTDLEFRPVMDAISRLRREQDRPPTIAALRAAVRAHTPERAELPDYSDAVALDDVIDRIREHDPEAAAGLDRGRR